MDPHPQSELQKLRIRLTQIHSALENFRPLIPRPPILDSSFDKTDDPGEENQWLQQGIGIPGLKKLKDDIKIDVDILDKFLDDPNCANLPPISTNAPYVISVWNEVLCAPSPIVSVFKTFLLNPKLSVGEKHKKRAAQQHPPGAKVDVVADNGRRWIRVNTIKNSRLRAELREIDSYLTDSDEDSDEDWDNKGRPSLAQTEFDNSILTMGRSLLEAAKANSLEGTSEIPRVTLRLTRLDPDLPNDDGTPADARIWKTLDMLRNMGIDVALGERSESELAGLAEPQSHSTSNSPPIPTHNINLDLSVLIALISDLTHSPLPSSIEDANRRFVPPHEYREWKQKRMEISGKHKAPDLGLSALSISSANEGNHTSSAPSLENDINDLPRDLIKHARALTNQLLQEMSKGLLQEIHDKISSSGRDKAHADDDDPSSLQPKVTFWTTSEARDRCLRIVSKIGGVHEKRRAFALFRLSVTNPTDFTSELSLEEAQELYWQDSRFAKNIVPLHPIRILQSTPSSDLPHVVARDANLNAYAQLPRSAFALELAKVCSDILSEDTIRHPESNQDVNGTLFHSSSATATISNSAWKAASLSYSVPEEIERARFTKANPRLTAHTVQSMQWGAELGWTILTANRTSVKAILKELKGARVAGKLAGVSTATDGGEGEQGQALEDGKDVNDCAAIWIVDPRSLAEGMSSLPARNA